MDNYNHIEKRIRAAFKDNEGAKIDIVKLLTSLDLELMINPRDTYRKEAIIKAIIFRDLKGLKFETSLEQFLNKNKDTALKFGFLKGDNNEVEIPDRRTFSHFLKYRITEEDKQLIRFVEKTLMDISERFDIRLVSNETNTTVKLEKKVRVTEEMTLSQTSYLRGRVFPKINLKVNKNAKCTKNQILDTLTYVSKNRNFTNGGTDSFHREKNLQNYPKAYTILRHLKRSNYNEVSKILNDSIKEQFKEVKKRLGIRKINIAIDWTKICFYEKRHKTKRKNKVDIHDFLIGEDEKNGTTDFYKFLTADIVHDSIKFTLAVVPMRPGISRVDAVRELLEKVKELIPINTVLADRGFNGTEIFNLLDSMRINYIMPIIRNKAVQRFADQMPLYTIAKNAVLYGDYILPVFVKVEGKGKLEMCLGSNIKFTRDDAQFAHHLKMMYNRRWVIESGYKDKKHGSLAMTTSTDYIVRYFYFAFSVILYDLWGIVNLLLMVSVNLSEIKRKFVTFLAFLEKLYNIIIT